MSRISKLAKFTLTDDEYDWVVVQLEALKIRFDNPEWSLSHADAPHTQKQVGYLAGLMDLERPDRIELLEIITDLTTHWDFTDWYPGSDEIVEMEYPEEYPGRSSKDLRITRWMHSVLVDYYIDGEGLNLNETLGYTSQSSIIEAKRAQRLLDKQAKELGFSSADDYDKQEKMPF